MFRGYTENIITKEGKDCNMFRCDFCENYKDKSECRQHPIEDARGNVCEECADEYEADKYEKERGMTREEETLTNQQESNIWYLINSISDELDHREEGKPTPQVPGLFLGSNRVDD